MGVPEMHSKPRCVRTLFDILDIKAVK